MLRKYVVPFLLFLAICFIAVSCRGSSKKEKPSWSKSSSKLKVLSTTAIIDNLIEEIGKDKVHHISLITGELDPHSYELVKGDNEKIAYADVIFYNGLELEHGASLKYQLLESKNAHAIASCMQDKNNYIFIDGQVDPHIWMDARMMASAMLPVAEILGNLDPDNAAFYLQNAKALQEKMLALDQEIETLLQGVSEKNRYLITSHDAFYYFTRRYLAEKNELVSDSWKKRCRAPEGLAPDGQMSPKDIAAIIEHALEYKISVVFTESNVNQDALKKIVRVLKQKGQIALLSEEPLYGDALGPSGSKAATYLEMMRCNAQNIAKHLQGESAL